ncbi:CDP-glucose 4,6-dehydratase [Paenibacillus sp. N3.4]|uniref:CDP-glucose 4,6-dehydratase n=1 Tax=Paenibacillus sp. N3.4 TaxID=2603222 RepID=UPI0011CBA8B8|nr:CDP-glucose 4,6-dehydratase [Paenibacillus sp. N3.4]TXK76911.1 CDP-glucose 4,6-dehydratase [Paenibacillus sp. N3.4]
MRAFWEGKKVFITGHTGFKGTWLCLFLASLGAKVTGYALNPPTEPSLYKLCDIDKLISNSYIGDIRDSQFLEKAIIESDPEIVIHMAAQPLVRDSYKNPVETYSINIMGTVNVLEAIRKSKTVRAVVNVTTDKCYENKEWAWGYRENEPLGGYDPYSSSKACSELVTSAYRNSFFNQNEGKSVAIATARAGNVIGGGDWAEDRLIPDCIRSLLANDRILIRNPNSIRPWQHVLEPLSGYLLLAQKLFEKGTDYAEAWNFGPYDVDAKPVNWIVDKICKKWGQGADYDLDQSPKPHEAQYLKLDCSKAFSKLGWQPKWSLDQALDKILEWTVAYKENNDIKATCFNQIEEYLNTKP